MFRTMMDYTPIAGEYNKVESVAKTLLCLGYPAVTRHLAPAAGKTILDFGCGTGIFSRYLHKQGAAVTGVDISPGMIDESKRVTPGNGIRYYTIDPGDLGRFRDQSFDHVVSNFVLCAIPTVKMIQRTLSEIHRVLRTNGTFILMNSNWEASNGREFVSFRLEHCDKLTPGCSVHAITKSDPPIIFEDYFHSMQEYQVLMEEAGFTLESVEQPLASVDESFWLDEKEFPPFFLLVGRKQE